MFDLDLLRTFVTVVDSGGFTRAGERVNRTQSTVSQQVKRLEDAIGRPLFHRDRKAVQLTEDGERLLGYARRLLALSSEAADMLARPANDGVIRLGLTEDFATFRLTEALAEFAHDNPYARLDVTCGLSVDLQAALAREDLDVILAKRDPGQPGPGAHAEFVAGWPERLVWIGSARLPLALPLRRPERHIPHDPASRAAAHLPGALPPDPVPIAAFPQGCLYRARAIHALESDGLPWRIAYTSPNLAGIQAAVAAGLGVAIVEHRAVLPQHQVLGAADGFAAVPPTELALYRRRGLSRPATRLVDHLKRFCADPTQPQTYGPVFYDPQKHSGAGGLVAPGAGMAASADSSALAAAQPGAAQPLPLWSGTGKLRRS